MTDYFFYKSVVEESSLGYSYNKIIANKENQIDYEILEMN